VNSVTFFIPKNKSIERAITVAVIIFFVLASLAGAAEPVICIEQEKSHLLAQGHFYPSTSHASDAVQSVNLFPQDIYLTSGGDHKTPCVDIYLNFCDSSIPSNQIKRLLPVRMPSFLVSEYVCASNKTSSQVSFCADFQTYHANSPLVILQTTVLLI
jgi:hypothetical protein